jgi:hypothetical protein
MEGGIMKILSIDAWGNKKDGYEWNQWFNAGEISKEEFESLDTDKKILMWMRKNGYIITSNKNLVYVEDDQWNKVIVDKRTKCPLFAIEYGSEY